MRNLKEELRGQDPNAQAEGAADGAEEVTDVDFEEVEEEAK